MSCCLLGESSQLERGETQELRESLAFCLETKLHSQAHEMTLAEVMETLWDSLFHSANRSHGRVSAVQVAMHALVVGHARFHHASWRSYLGRGIPQTAKSVDSSNYLTTPKSVFKKRETFFQICK